MAKVFVVLREYQADTPEIVGVFTHEAAAQAKRRALVQEHLSCGDLVEPWDGEDEDEGYENRENFEDCDWQVDINVEAFELDESNPGPACGHSACSQNYIDTGEAACVKDEEPEGEDTGLYVNGYRVYRNGSEREDFGADR